MDFRKTILILLAWLPSLVLGQDDFLTGKILDAETNEPVVFATIQIKGKAIGVISNQDGSFKIPLFFKSEGDTLQISSIGYVTKSLLMQKLVPGMVNRIMLGPAVEVLDEVVVRAESNRNLSADMIVRKAVDRINRNSSRVPYSYVGYYRDYQLKDSLYFNLNEALVEVFDRGFGTIDHDATNIEIYDYKRNPDFPRDTIAEKPYDYQSRNKTIEGAALYNFGGNELMILRIHDPIRNHAINSFDFINTLDSDFEKNHTFEREEDIILNNERLFVISIGKEEGNHRVRGKLFVSQHSFAIHKMEYAIYRGGKKLPNNKLYDYSKEANEKFFEVQIEYKLRDGIMYLNYLSFSNDFQVHRPPVFKINSVSVDWQERCFTIDFSQIPVFSEATNKRRYVLRYKGKRVKIDRVEVKGGTAHLFPKATEINADFEIFNLLPRDVDLSKFTLKSKNIKDVNGNRINKPATSKVIQFREFFVQQVKPKNESSANHMFMNKNQPIFDNQPVARPDNFDDYWMNTPLQNILDEKNRP